MNTYADTIIFFLNSKYTSIWENLLLTNNLKIGKTVIQNNEVLEF